MGSSELDLRNLDVVQVAEHLAKLLHLDSGERALNLTFSEGKLRRGDVHMGPLRPLELIHLSHNGMAETG